VSFIQPSGLELLFDPLLEALNNGANIRLLTSDYLDITLIRTGSNTNKAARSAFVFRSAMPII